MGLAHILKLAGKFVLRGFVFKAGKKAALRGGNVGIGAMSLLAGGYMAYSLLQKREKRKKSEKSYNKRKISNKEQIIV